MTCFFAPHPRPPNRLLQVDHATELLRQSTATTHELLRALAKASGISLEDGDAVPVEHSAQTPAPRPTFGGAAGQGSGAPLAGNGSAPDTLVHTASADQSADTSQSHPAGWFSGKLPSFGTCGGRRGSLSEIWEVWGGAGPEKVTGGGSGFSLRAHGETSVKEQEQWGSTSNYGRYLQAGRYMDKKIASIKVKVLLWPV